MPLSNFLKFHTNLEEDSVRSFQNVLNKCSRVLRASLREDQAEVIHAISPFSMKLCQVEGTTQ